MKCNQKSFKSFKLFGDNFSRIMLKSVQSACSDNLQCPVVLIIIAVIFNSSRKAACMIVSLIIGGWGSFVRGSHIILINLCWSEDLPAHCSPQFHQTKPKLTNTKHTKTDWNICRMLDTGSWVDGRFAINAVKNTTGCSKLLTIYPFFMLYCGAVGNIWSRRRRMSQQDLASILWGHWAENMQAWHRSCVEMSTRGERGISTPGPVSSVFLCYQLTSRHAWAKQRLVVTSGSWSAAAAAISSSSFSCADHLQHGSHASCRQHEIGKRMSMRAVK